MRFMLYFFYVYNIMDYLLLALAVCFDMFVENHTEQIFPEITVYLVHGIKGFVLLHSIALFLLV